MEIIGVFRLEDSIFLRCQILPNLIYRFNTIKILVFMSSIVVLGNTLSWE